MDALVTRLLKSAVVWLPTPQSPYLFSAEFEDRMVQLRFNDFPDEPLCTVIIDAVETHIDERPQMWQLPM